MLDTYGNNTKESTYKGLDKIATLEKNWDANGAESFAPECIEFCKMFIDKHDFYIPYMSHTSDCILFSYESNKGNIQVRVFNFDRILMFVNTQYENYSDTFTRKEVNDLYKAVREFIKELE